MTDTITLTIKGVSAVTHDLELIRLYLSADLMNGAEQDIADLLLAERGGGKPFYPPETYHNDPNKNPHYTRGVGEIMNGVVISKSERMSEAFYHYTTSNTTYIGNATSYAADVIGESQDPFFVGIGWSKFISEARRQIRGLVFILDKHIGRAIARFKLRKP